MTKILYTRAEKMFMDAISEGYDEHGAIAKVEKKFGKVLANAVWSAAKAEEKAIRGNPRKFNPSAKRKLHVTIKISSDELHMLKWALEDYPTPIYPLTQNRNACKKLTEKELMKTVSKNTEMGKKYPHYTLTDKGKELITKYLSHIGAK